MKKIKIYFLVFYSIVSGFINTTGNNFNTIFELKKTIKLEQTNLVYIGSVRQCLINKKNIIITDSKMHNIKIYTINGELLKIVGKKGQGPGEFKVPMGLTDYNHYILVSDIGNGRMNIFDKESLNFLRSFTILDGREIKVLNNKIYSSFVDFGTNTSLHIYNLDGKNIKNCIDIPKITIDNKLISDNTSFDFDSKGNVYFVNEMKYEVLKCDTNCNVIKLIQGKDSKYYRKPPSKPIEDIYSRKKIINWANSWTHVLKILVLEKQQKLLLYTSDKKYGDMLDIYSLSGKSLYKNIKTGMRLLCKDKEDNVYFLKQIMNGDSIEFIINKYELKKH